MRLDTFDPNLGLDRGVPRWKETLWYLCKLCFVLSALPWPMSLKRAILRAFGAKIGQGVILKPRINIHFPWKLEIGDHAWIGEEVFILNFERVRIGSHSCLSQRAFLCCGNHDFRSADFRYRNAPISVGDTAWIGAQVFVGPGVDIGSGAVLTAGSIATRSLPPDMICSGHPCQPVQPRYKGGSKATNPPSEPRVE